MKIVCEQCKETVEKMPRKGRIIRFCSSKCYGISIKGIPSATKGIKFSEEHNRKLSETMRRQYASGERVSARGMLGKKASLETRQKMSETLKRIGHQPPHGQGERSPSWKGDKVQYRGLHSWVEKTLGKPYECKNCHAKTLRPRQYHWANRSGRYLRETSDWVRLCVKCHKAFDSKKLKLTI